MSKTLAIQSDPVPPVNPDIETAEDTFDDVNEWFDELEETLPSIEEIFNELQSYWEEVFENANNFWSQQSIEGEIRVKRQTDGGTTKESKEKERAKQKQLREVAKLKTQLTRLQTQRTELESRVKNAKSESAKQGINRRLAKAIGSIAAVEARLKQLNASAN